MPVSTTNIDETDPISRDDLEALASERPGPCVSLYLPTERAAQGQDPKRLANLIDAAAAELELLGWDEDPGADGLLAPARALLESREFWRHQADGLAVLLAPGFARTVRAAIPFAEEAIVSGRLHLRPLLPLVSGDRSFWLLAISQNSVRLFRGSRHALSEVDPGDAPADMAEALAFEDPEKQFQVRSAGPNAGGMAHSHGAGGEVEKAALGRYFRAVDRGIAPVLRGSSSPLVIAAVDYYGPIYRSVSTYPHLLDEVVAGSPDKLGAAALHDAAWPALEPQLAARRDAALERYGNGRPRELTVEGIGATLAVAEGQIDLLLLPESTCFWAASAEAGEAETRSERQPGDLDVLDLLAARVLRTGGELDVLDDGQVPDGAAVAALLRHP